MANGNLGQRPGQAPMGAGAIRVPPPLQPAPTAQQVAHPSHQQLQKLNGHP